jgi:hypothetical protein
MARRDFNEEVTRAIDAALSEILGKPTLGVLYKHLKEHCGISSDQMPHQIPTIIRVLEEIFGAVGASSIGSDVAKKLYSQLGLTFVEHSNCSLEDYIEEARKLLPKP